MSLSEKQKIISELKAGSYHAFEVLYAEYFDFLYGYVFGMVRSHTQSKEIVQDTFIKVWLHRSKINPELSFKAWLFKIAKNQLLNEIKKNFSDPVFEDFLVHCENNDLVVHADMEFDFELFRIALVKAKQKLSPRQTQVFELHKEEGLPATEVAQKLNITEDSVYNYLSQSLALLRKEMNELSLIIFMVFMQ